MFVQGGYVYPGSYLYDAGSVGNYWSSVGYNGSNAYYLFFYPYGVNPSYDYYRYYGLSVRCVALGG